MITEQEHEQLAFNRRYETDVFIRRLIDGLRHVIVLELLAYPWLNQGQLICVLEYNYPPLIDCHLFRALYPFVYQSVRRNYLF